jgi:phosphohistidine phosphatase
MDMILWRTAEAEENSHDLARKLTAKGKKQCERVAGWLDQRLPARFTVLSSPALRAQQTAQSLGIPVKPENALAPRFSRPRPGRPIRDWSSSWRISRT